MPGTGGRRPPPTVSDVLGVLDVLLGAAVLGVAAARTPARVPRAAVHRLPAPGRRALRRARAALRARGLTERHLLTGRLGAVTDAAVPAFARAALARVDVPDLLARFVDLDRVVALVDLQRAVDRVDVDRIAARLDVDRVAARLDLDAVIDRLDLDRVADRLDVDRVAARLDLDAVIDRVDPDRIADRLDVVALARYVVDAIDLPDLIRSSTGTLTTEVVSGVRSRGAEADQAVDPVVDRRLRRSGRRARGDGTGSPR
ncbi:hypothetical protein ACI8AC_13030 [Geodermatophilus sp. SYSU D00758]